MQIGCQSACRISLLSNYESVNLVQSCLEGLFDFLTNILKISVYLGALEHTQCLNFLGMWVKNWMCFPESFPTHAGEGFKNAVMEVLFQGHGAQRLCMHTQKEQSFPGCMQI